MGNTIMTYNAPATAQDLAGASGSGSFNKGVLTISVTPTSVRTGNVLTITSDGVSGKSGGFSVVS